MIRAFVVDDEMPARNELKRFLKDETDFSIVGEAMDGEKALADIGQLKPDVVFLDIHIPKLNGLEVAARLCQAELPPAVIFVTAFDEYAIRAFEVNAVDYILKPYDKDRFKKACEKARQLVKDQKTVKEKLNGLTDYLAQQKARSLIGQKRHSRDRIFIHPDDIVYFHIQLTEVLAVLRNGQELIMNSTLKVLLEKLEPEKFQQCHRSYVVNLDGIEKISPLFSGNYEIILKNDQKIKIPLSRRYAKKIRKILKW